MQLIMNTKLQWIKRKWTKEISPLTVIRKTNKLRNIFSCYLDVWLRRNECLRISMIVFFFPSTFIHRGMILQEFFVNLSIRRRMTNEYRLFWSLHDYSQKKKKNHFNGISSADQMMHYESILHQMVRRKWIQRSVCVCIQTSFEVKAIMTFITFLSLEKFLSSSSSRSLRTIFFLFPPFQIEVLVQYNLQKFNK